MNTDFQVSLRDMLEAVSEAIDLINPKLTGHHKRVAYIAGSIAKAMDLEQEERTEIVWASYLHDFGIIGLKDSNQILDLDHEENTHAQIGYRLLKDLPEINKVAIIVREHHTSFKEMTKKNEKGLIGSEIIYLSDRVDVLLDRNSEPLSQVEGILEWLEKRTNTKFNPRVFYAFSQVAKREAFWLDLVHSSLEKSLGKMVYTQKMELSADGLLSFGKFFSQIIDFRSRFTATHSRGVAASAVYLAKLVGFSLREQAKMQIAGYLHDLGKLSVPSDILEKDKQLSIDEFNLIKKHTYYTYRILEDVEGLEEIAVWAGLHHEKPNGQGYPFGLKGEDIPLGARIMAVADVFTALTEKRPYRRGMNKFEATANLRMMARNGFLDTNITALAISFYDDLNRVCRHEQAVALEEYKRFSADLL